MTFLNMANFSPAASNAHNDASELNAIRKETSDLHRFLARSRSLAMLALPHRPSSHVFSCREDQRQIPLHSDRHDRTISQRVGQRILPCFKHLEAMSSRFDAPNESAKDRHHFDLRECASPIHVGLGSLRTRWCFPLRLCVLSLLPR